MKIFKVKAKKLCFIGGERKRPGVEFLVKPEFFSEKGMEKISEIEIEDRGSKDQSKSEAATKEMIKALTLENKELKAKLLELEKASKQSVKKSQVEIEAEAVSKAKAEAEAVSKAKAEEEAVIKAKAEAEADALAEAEAAKNQNPSTKATKDDGDEDEENILEDLKELPKKEIVRIAIESKLGDEKTLESLKKDELLQLFVKKGVEN